MIFFITGGSRGVGRALVQAALAANHDVAFTYVRAREQAAEVEALGVLHGRKCRAYQLDVCDSAAVEAVGEQVLEDFGTVDVVVSNAGIARDALAISMSDEDWHAVIETNLSGAFYVARQFLPTLLAAQRGRLIFISSIAHRGLTGGINYAASKAGLLGLSASLAREYGSRGITSNVVVPGLFDTDILDGELATTTRALWKTRCPLQRVGKLEELAAAVLFLASDGASYVNGHALSVTGGQEWAP